MSFRYGVSEGISIRPGVLTRGPLSYTRPRTCGEGADRVF